MPEICNENADLWTAKVVMICWKHVEWHRPDRVMRQFGARQSIEVNPIPSSFKRVDGRGRAETDWYIYHYDYIVQWNNRRQYLVPIIRLRGDIRPERRRYLDWYHSWVSQHILQPSTQPPTTYYPRSPNERYLVDYFIRTRGIADPFRGGTGDNASSMQLALDEIAELSDRVDRSMFIDYDAGQLREQPGEDIEIAFPRRRKQRSTTGNENRRRSTSDVPRRADQASTSANPPMTTTYDEPGPSTQWPTAFDVPYMTPGVDPSHMIDPVFSNPYGEMPNWMSPLLYNPAGPDWASGLVDQQSIWQARGMQAGSSSTDEQEEEGRAEHLLRERPTQAPTRYTPGSQALGRRKK